MNWAGIVVILCNDEFFSLDDEYSTMNGPRSGALNYSTTAKAK